MHYFCQGNQDAGRVLPGAAAEGGAEGEKPCDKFFVRRGLKASDAPGIRKLTIHLSIILRTGLDSLENLSVFDLVEIAEEVTETYGKK